MRAPIGEGRERLLQALFDAFGESGPSPNLSMRQVAERLGVHHTLLTYHFGSRPGLLGAVLSEARRRDNLVIAADDQLGFVDLCRAIWGFYSDDAHDDRSRAFFHLVGLSVYEPDAFQSFVADLDDLAALLEAAALRDGAAAADARQQSVLAVACLRGLLLQRLLTSGTDVDAAAERLFASLATSVV